MKSTKFTRSKVISKKSSLSVLCSRMLLGHVQCYGVTCNVMWLRAMLWGHVQCYGVTCKCFSCNTYFEHRIYICF